MQITWKSLKISEIIFQLFKYKRVRLYLTGALFAAVSHLDLVYPNKWLILNPRVHRNRLYISHLKNKLWWFICQQSQELCHHFLWGEGPGVRVPLPELYSRHPSSYYTINNVWEYSTSSFCFLPWILCKSLTVNLNPPSIIHHTSKWSLTLLWWPQRDTSWY